MMNAQTQKSQQGVMLLEALVAILIFSIGIVAVMGMQAASIAQVTQAKFRTDASYLASMTMADLAQVLRGENTIPMLRGDDWTHVRLRLGVGRPDFDRARCFD